MSARHLRVDRSMTGRGDLDDALAHDLAVSPGGRSSPARGTDDAHAPGADASQGNAGQGRFRGRPARWTRFATVFCSSPYAGTGSSSSIPHVAER
ncbi:hypothetical protein [Streptomyces sp900116325]|uniref:hypothetical protein n=1 Tax=Streptomyces sp. 900116325 TaxID=3154295 RepID=UPI0033AAD2F1